MPHVSFERRADGSILRVETPDAASLPSAYDRQLIAQRSAAPPAVSVETQADIDAVTKAQQQRLAVMRAQAPAPVPSSEYWHTSTERFGNKMVTKRSKRSGQVMATHETPIAPAVPTPGFVPTGFQEGPHGRAADDYDARCAASE